MIHAKAVVIDDELALAGTANLDERSLFLNYELMVAFYERNAVRGIRRMDRTSASLCRALPRATAQLLAGNRGRSAAMAGFPAVNPGAWPLIGRYSHFRYPLG